MPQPNLQALARNAPAYSHSGRGLPVTLGSPQHQVFLKKALAAIQKAPLGSVPQLRPAPYTVVAPIGS